MGYNDVIQGNKGICVEVKYGGSLPSSWCYVQGGRVLIE